MSQKCLIVIEGDYGLPSLEPECIQSIFYTSLADFPVNIKNYSSLKLNVLYSCPSLIDGSLVIKGSDNIITYLKSMKYDLDTNINAKQRSEIFALKSMVLSRLYPLLQFLKWVDERNCDEFTRRWYMKGLPFPFNYFYIKKQRQNASDLIETLYPQEDNMEVVKDYLTKQAVNCLSALSTRLGTKSYFFSENPTSLDVVVYSYVAPFLKLPFKNVDISINNLWPNLETFIKRIDAKYLNFCEPGVKYLKNDNATKSNDDEVSYGAVLLLSFSAITLLVGMMIFKLIYTPPYLR